MKNKTYSVLVVRKSKDNIENGNDFSGKLQNANINAGKQQLNAQYAQVTNHSGIIANTSSLNVQGQGNFTGGYLITDKDQNHTQVKQGIQTQDIHNYLTYQGDALQVGITINPNPNQSSTNQSNTSQHTTNHKLGLSGLGYGKIDPIHKTSMTKSAITDQAGLSHINTDTLSGEDAQQALNPIIDNDFITQKSQLEKELGGQVTITTEFGRQIPKQIGDYAQAKEIELLAQGNIEEAKKWAEGGVYRVALHTITAALATGSIEGAVSAGGADGFIGVDTPHLAAIQNKRHTLAAMEISSWTQPDATARNEALRIDGGVTPRSTEDLLMQAGAGTVGAVVAGRGQRGNGIGISASTTILMHSKLNYLKFGIKF